MTLCNSECLPPLTHPFLRCQCLMKLLSVTESSDTHLHVSKAHRLQCSLNVP
jgi:hypothetical protein